LLKRSIAVPALRCHASADEFRVDLTGLGRYVLVSPACRMAVIIAADIAVPRYGVSKA
jgi:hypothetical protein